ncbi:MAG: LPS-assembly protein LptD [Deltaproteobacteria bacterium]|nr:LPS-assembly protein LptD [Deltaproteobacteria bacterium]
MHTSSKIHEALRHAEGGLPVIRCRILFMTAMLLFIFFTAGARCSAEEPPRSWHITADKIVNLADDDLFVAEGTVIISREDQILTADRVTYNRRSAFVRAEGNVRLSSAGHILRCERGTFNLNDGTAYLLRGSLFLGTNHFYIRGRDMWKTGPSTYFVKGCRITSCDGESPDWSITGSEVEVTIEGYGTAKHAAFFVKRVPLLYFPYIIFPAKRKRQTGFLPPSVGYSERNGMDFELPFFWATSQQTDATFYERYLAERGVKHGLEVRYITGVDSKGAFLYDTISDRRESKDMFSEDDLKISPYPRTNQKRYWFRSRADQRFPFGIVSRLDVDFVSDYDYLREFKRPDVGTEYRAQLDEESGRPLEEVQSPTRRSALRLSRDFQDFSVQALASYYQRPERPEQNTTAQPLAGLDLAILPRRIVTLPVFFSLESDYASIYRETGYRGQRLALGPSISYPLWPIPFLEIEPSVTYLMTTQWIEEHQGHRVKQTKDAYELGLRISTILERVFAVERGTVKSVKHKFQPELTYILRPYPEEGEFSPWFEPVDTLGRLNSISLSLQNYLDARREDKEGKRSYSQSSNLTLTQPYDLDEATEDKPPGVERKPFGPLSATLSLTPYPALNLSASAYYDHYEEYLSSGSVGLDLTVMRGGSREDTYSIDYVYSRDSTKQLNYEIAINLLYGLSVGAEGMRDLIEKHDIEDTYWIEYHSQCWGIRLLYEDLDEDKRIMLNFSLLGFGRIGTFTMEQEEFE